MNRIILDKYLSKLLSSNIAQLCGIIITLLGFSGCDKDNGGDEPALGPCMYGTPYATFEMKGMVTDENDQPVADAVVRVSDSEDTITEENSDWVFFAKGVTDQNGYYCITGREFGPKAIRIECLPDDPNLEPQTLIIDVQYDNPNDNNDDHWGHADLTVDFKLKAKSL
ncbi:MAG: hypothetical protein HDS67_08355 [Bacteroidales bacterium]|nr:hypothetical protein [Bacteroidales bacterium]